MFFQFSPLTPLFVAASLVFGACALYFRPTWSQPLQAPVTLFFWFAAIWAFGDACIYAVADPGAQLAFTTISFIGISGMPVSLFLIACVFSGLPWFSSDRRAALLFIVPAASILLVATNSLHGFFYSGVTRQEVLGTTIWGVSYGPLYPIHPVYSYLLIVASLVILISRYPASTPRVRRQITLLSLGILVPLIANLLYLVRLWPFPGFDPTPLALLVTTALIASGNLRLGLFRVVPLAHSTIIESMDDAILVLDRDGRLVDMNRAATAIAGETIESLEGTDGCALLSRWGTRDAARPDIIFRGDGEVVYEVRSHPLRGRETTLHGTVLFVREITEVSRARRGLEEANRKLTLLSGITRHDILNQLMVLRGYLSLSRAFMGDPDQLLDCIGRAEQAAANIQEQITFTQEYQDMGVQAPEWQDLQEVAERAVIPLSPRETRISLELRGIEVFADLLIERVFYNLLENALKYGGEEMTAIRLHAEESGEELTITCEDDGQGIAEADKPRLFERGYGKGTGLGLFLSQEILAITGISIRETGAPGKGARFELVVPPGRYRLGTAS